MRRLEEGVVRLESDRDGRHGSESAGSETELRADGKDLAVCGRRAPPGGAVRLHADERASRSGKIPGRISGISASRRLLGLRRFFKEARGLVEVGCWMHARRYFFQ